MSAQNPEVRRTVRVVAFSAAQRGVLRTVNILTAPKTSAHKEKLQATGAQATANPNVFRTVMDSGGQIAGLPTIVIAGYVGPN